MAILKRSLTLKDLPPPPSDRTGWPWTEENQPLPERMPDGSEWPRISVVTPSYNYGMFIEETIRSVLLQGYPNLEYIIIDGGSTDNSIQIIKKYEQYLAYWVSEPDEGQTDAINKGFSHCTGDLFVWLNSDDSYIDPTCFKTVSELSLKGYQLIAGSCQDVYTDGRKEIVNSMPATFERYLRFWLYRGWPQPSVFIDKKIANNCFPLDKKLYGLMDYQLFLRSLQQNPKSIFVNRIWTEIKYHGASKTEQNYAGGFAEFCQVAGSESKNLPQVSRFLFSIELEDYIAIHSIIYQTTLPNFGQMIHLLASRLTLARWKIFWRLMLQSILVKKI
ncbi:MAG TPA: glycosyltransferase family 2 protein [Leptolyngbyaceae cyanobacterium]